MPSNYTYRPRLSVEIDQSLKDRLDKLIRWGQLKHVMGPIILDLVEALEGLSPADREMAIAAIIASKLRPKEFITSLKGE